MDYEKIFEEETRTNRAVEWGYYVRGKAGSFVAALCRAWELGDLQNRHRLALAFPRLFSAALVWQFSDNPEQFIEQLLKDKK